MNIIQNLSGQVNAALLNELTELKAQLAAVEQERDTLRALVLKLPVVEGEILTNGESWWVRREDGDYPVPEIPFDPIAALLDYRRGG